MFSKFVRQTLQSRSGTDRCRHARLIDNAAAIKFLFYASGLVRPATAGVKPAINNFTTVRISSATILLSSGLHGAHTVMQVPCRSFARRDSG